MEERGKAKQAKMVREISGGLHFSYTRQSEALGLGHAVLTARELVGDEPFAVLLGDVIMDGKVPATRSLVEIYEETGVGAIAVEEVPRERLHFYGIVDAATGKGEKSLGRAIAADQGSGREARAGKGAVKSGRHGALRVAA